MADNEIVEGIDFYWQGPYMVFTEEFLRKRGYCCESGCRHCPWGYAPGARDGLECGKAETSSADPAPLPLSRRERGQG